MVFLIFFLWTKNNANFHLQEKAILPFLVAIKDGTRDVESIQLSPFLISLVFSTLPPPVRPLWCFWKVLGCSFCLMCSLLPVRPPLTDSWDGASEFWFRCFSGCCTVGPSLTNEAIGVVLRWDYLGPQIQIHSNEWNWFWFAIQESEVPECQPSISFPWSLAKLWYDWDGFYLNSVLLNHSGNSQNPSE